MHPEYTLPGVPVQPAVPSGVDMALYAATCGFPVFPVLPQRGLPFAAGTMNEALGLPADAPAGVHHASIDAGTIRRMWAGNRAGAWIGLAMGDGMLAIDLDEKNGKSGTATLQAKGWTIPITATQRTKSAGWHCIVQVSAGEIAATDSDVLGSGVDRRGDGGYIVLYDPAILAAQRAMAPVWALAASPRAGERIAPDAARRAPSYDAALAALRSREPDMDRGEWLLFSGAFYAGTIGLADDETRLADWQAWCAGYGEANDPAANRRTWAGFRHGTNGDWSDLARMGHDATAKALACFGANPDIPARPMQAANDPAGPALFVRVADMMAQPPVFLIESYMEEDAFACLFGDPASGKSLVAIDMSASVATGHPFHGRPVAAGPVFYIAGEGKNGLRRRFAAWEAQHGISLADAPLFVSVAAVQFLDAPSAVLAAAAIDTLAAAHGTPRLIVIDTLARNFGPGDENSTADMNAFVAALDTLRGRYAGSSLLLVHHSGHGDKGRGRGSSVLRAALDCEYLVEKKGSAVHLSNSKMKDTQPPPTMAFDLVEAADSVALEHTGTPAGTVTKMAAGETLALQALQAAMVDGVADDTTWREAFRARRPDDAKPDTTRRAFNRAKDKLIAAGMVMVDGDHYRRPPMPGAPQHSEIIGRTAGHCGTCPVCLVPVRAAADGTDRTHP
ncbi:hypothetical protein CA235_02435 [Sphingomonas sp. ABOLF]|uniref:AAA family ATPase n=1 Tax=Sphingomonas sp. ABOLF TaxID=1985879 RepID=UPI000F7EC4E7|nr:AAA family ATPase [Sphingomonas sp. ABOLF]RSV17503.1 hypothetical protein CA235_02435 [Sphingomonas sp. ABOLF]